MMENAPPIPLENLKEILREKRLLAANAILALGRKEISAEDASAIVNDLNAFIEKVEVVIRKGKN